MQRENASLSAAVGTDGRCGLADFELVLETCATPGECDVPPQPAAASPRPAAVA
jgi:hypothetical protein